MEKENWFYDAWIHYGIVLEWYDTPKGMVTVGWWYNGELYETNPCHVSKLEVISESR
jgi:hypothetical protein